MKEERRFNVEEKRCLQIYDRTYKRGKSGRYSVALPFRNEIVNLGGSRNRALLQLVQMEKKFALNPELKMQYTEFMNEYIEMAYERM